MSPNPTTKHAARLKFELAMRGLTCAQIERRHRLYKGQCRKALYEPDEAGERAIAQALGQTPQELWPERFDPTGVRLIPQPRANYRTRSSGESRRNRAAA
jgi:Ner family transcriptional regulator